jgi:hypothetical protein
MTWIVKGRQQAGVLRVQAEWRRAQRGWQAAVVEELGALFLSRAHTAFREGEDLGHGACMRRRIRGQRQPC